MTAPQMNLPEIQRAIFDVVNEHRMSKSLSAVQLNEFCTELAVEHSINMSLDSVPFSHDGFQDRANRAVEGLDAEAVGENVAYNFHTPESLINAWANSEAHRKVLEGDFTHMGIGVADDDDGNRYYTQFMVRI